MPQVFSTFISKMEQVHNEQQKRQPGMLLKTEGALMHTHTHTQGYFHIQQEKGTKELREVLYLKCDASIPFDKLEAP